MKSSLAVKTLLILAGILGSGAVAAVPMILRATIPPSGAEGDPRAAGVSSAGSEEAPAYLRDLRAGDYTTYTHPMFGFSLDVPKEFEVFHTTIADKDHTLFRHPRLPLALEINVYPMPHHPELVSWLAALPADYDFESPEGADSTAVQWLDENQPSPSQHTMHVWFAHQDSLYEILLMAPDSELLQWWRPQVVNTALTLPAR